MTWSSFSSCGQKGPQEQRRAGPGSPWPECAGVGYLKETRHLWQALQVPSRRRLWREGGKEGGAPGGVQGPGG